MITEYEYIKYKTLVQEYETALAQKRFEDRYTSKLRSYSDREIHKKKVYSVSPQEAWPFNSTGYGFGMGSNEDGEFRGLGDDS